MNPFASSSSDVPQAWVPLSAARRAQRLALGTAGPLAMAATPWWLEHGASVGCVFRALTGLPCPLCGGTHACAALVQGDWAGAWAANPGALGLLALLALWALQAAAEGALGWRRAYQWPWARPVALQLMLGGLLLSWGMRVAGLL